MRVVILLIFFLLSTNCVEKINKKDQKSTVKQLDCLSKRDKIKILNSILSHQDVYKFLHINLPERMPIKILSNDYFNDSLTFEYKQEKVLFVKNYEKYNDALSIELSEINCSNNIVKFGFFSKIEGADILGIVKKNNQEQWITSITQVGYH